jgi:acetyl-CoA carboxylase alpha subunit
MMMENAIYSVISPEGAASIIYRDTKKAEEMASALKLTALDCKELGVIDTVVPEPEGSAHADPDEAARLLKNTIVRELLEAQKLDLAKLIKNRYKKFRRMGEYSSYFRTAISKEVSDVQELLQRGVSSIKQRLSTADKANQ